MHSWLTRLACGGAVMAAVITATAPAVSAEANDNANPPTNDEYSHAAQFVAHAGGGSGSSDRGCQLTHGPNAGKPAHLEWNSYPEGDGTYSVWLNCVLDGYDVPSDRSQEFPDFDFWQVDWFTFGVVPQDPQDLVADALARHRPPEAGIFTNPGAGAASLVGIDTWLWLDESVYGYQEVWDYDGPASVPDLLAVRIWAQPKPGGTVVWSSADGSKTCPDSGANPPGSCTYEFNRSSSGQPDADGRGRPAYELTASYSYTGGYDVYVMGQLLESGTLEDIPRTSVTYLAVNEAQAINTGSGGG
jgi:hypothetical protein